MYAATAGAANMKTVTIQMDDGGFSATALGRISRGYGSKVEATYLQNSRPIKANEILVLPPIAWIVALSESL